MSTIGSMGTDADRKWISLEMVVIGPGGRKRNGVRKPLIHVGMDMKCSTGVIIHDSRDRDNE
jgi:hypothetical protein